MSIDSMTPQQPENTGPNSGGPLPYESVQLFLARHRMSPEERAQSLSLHRFPGRMVVDGGTATQKSVYAREIAEHYGAIFLDTGLLYRGVAHVARMKNIPLDDHESLTEIASSLTLDFKRCKFQGRSILEPVIVSMYNKPNRVDLTRALKPDDIRDTHINLLEKDAGIISELLPVRKALEPILRALGPSFVLASRNVGIEIFPDADVKILVVSSIEERVQLKEEQFQGSCSTEEIKRQILEVDRSEASRADFEFPTINNAAQHGYEVVQSGDAALTEMYDLIQKNIFKLK